MARLSLFLLGPPQIEVDGRPLDVGRRKAEAMLAYLAVTGRGHSRDTLAAMFWPDSDQAGARANLRRTLSALNTALDGPWLDADREIVGLDRSAPVSVDVEEFRRRLGATREHGHAEDAVCPECLAPLAESAALYRDDFMAGFSLRDSPDFDDWQFFQAESLRRELAGALERLVRVYCDREEYTPAIDYARRWLRLDPLQEAAHRRLMELYARTGQRPAALRQFHECARVLEEELGISPSPETRALHERIQSGSLEPDTLGHHSSAQSSGFPASQPSIPPTSQSSDLPAIQPSTSPFVGREAELARLGHALETALAGAGHVVFVAGEAGSGKTALLHEFARRAQDATPDLVVAAGICNAHTGLGDPYLPFRDMLGLLAGQAESQVTISSENARRLAALLPSALQALAEVAPDLVGSFLPTSLTVARAAGIRGARPAWLERLEQLAQRGRADAAQPVLAPPRGPGNDLFAQVTALLQALARRRPLLLLLDDTQWADAASVTLLFHLGRRLRQSPILLLVTYRPDEVSAGRGDGRHPLEPVINELKRTYGDVEIELDPAMGREFIDEFLDVEANRLGEAFRSDLYRQTGGHPLFTIELLRAMQARGDLVHDAEGRWVEGPNLDWETLPARVEAVIEERIGRLEEDLRDVLAVASVEGETFTAQVVARVQGLGERLLLRRLSQELERRHHLVQALGEVRVDGYFLSRYRFTHTLFQQYLYSNFSPGERRLLHGEVANALEDFYQGEGDDVSVQLARHYAEAGQTAQAVDYLLRAGDRARNLFAHQEAVEFYQRALGFLKEQGAHERTARTLMKLGLTYHMAFDFTRARAAYQEGFVLWQRAGADQPAAGPPAPHPLRLAWFDPPTLDPALCGDDNSGFLIHQLFSGLVTLNADMDVVLEVARTWDVLDGGQRYLFHLREDARWSDGRPLTADDFVFAWRRVLDPAVASPNASYLFDVVGGRDYYEGRLHDPEQIGLRALDERTLLVELIGPVSSFPHRLTLAGLYPVPRHALEAHGPAWTAPDKLVANGAFRLESWQPGQAMRLARSPSYRGPFTGNVMRVELVLNLSSAEQMDLYEAGQLDMVSLFSPGEAVRARQRHAGEYFVRPAPFVQYLGFSVSQPPVDDVRVRRALAMAIDKESLAGVVLSGHVFPVTGGFVPPGMPGYSPGISLPYDPAQARALLAEAGYPGGRGFPAVEALVNRPNKAVAAQGITQQWREVLGIEMTWETMEFSDLLERMAQRPPALFYMGWRADYPDPENPLRVGTQRGWTGWQNPVFTDLLERAQRLADPAERLRLYQQADRILIEEAPIVPLIQLQYHLLVKPWVSSFPVGPIHWPSWKEVVIEPHP